MIKPQLWVIAGPNGAGKSTLVRQHFFGKLPIVNPDDIAKDLSTDYSSNKTLEAGKIAVRQRSIFLAERRSFAIETTLTGRSEIRLMKAAGKAGFKVNLIFIGLDDVTLSAARVALRVRTGGHAVPAKDIFRRYDRCMANLPIAMNYAVRVWIIDNSDMRRRLLLARETNKIKHLVSSLPCWFSKVAEKEIAAARLGKMVIPVAHKGIDR
ncbi:zeta toxin family protein [Candidatus Regiella insecticola]|uniref:Zeta toxin family protein n=1 Tax=Candidatus Regiella insecticola TaxID=138073 RepID=A0A6L2ZSM6_9ENTR|nr:zeta toxin family protein [Candidatus Regiella insecticola]